MNTTRKAELVKLIVVNVYEGFAATKDGVARNNTGFSQRALVEGLILKCVKKRKVRFGHNS